MEWSEKLKRQARLIESSEDFDPSWYLAQYPDVAELGVSAAQHYLRWGARMGRNPSPGFDTAHYLASYPDVDRSGINPYIHYLTHGRAEGRSPRPGMRGGRSQQGQAEMPAAQVARRIDSSRIRCTIVLPVYDAHDEVLDCIHSVLRHTELGNGDRLLVLDDASPDPRIRDMLAAFSGIDGLEIVHNADNLGYTANVNLGCRLAGDDDVVLLNSDTIVGPHWLRNLKQAAHQHDRVGTVTAVSDNAGAFSVPEPGTNRRPEGLGVDAAARVAADTAAATTFEVPTGNGFCFYIRRELLRGIGSFDVDAFPRGYGEENDFCMRAVDAGWANLVAAGVYVAHVRSASFKDRKAALVEAGMDVVKQRHPAYAGAIKAISASLKFQRVRGELGAAFEDAARSGLGTKPRVMFALSTRTGGTPQTNRDLMEAISDVYDCYALRCDRRKIELLEATDTDYRVLRTWQLGDPVTFATHVSHEYDQIVRSILVDMSIDLLHVRHIAWHSLHLPAIARGVGIPVINSFHDFYAVCPTVNLIDREGNYWPTGVEQDGRNPLWKSDPTALPVTREVLGDWQRRMQDAFAPCDAFVTTCQTARDVICEALPALARRARDFHVIPHGRDFDAFERLAADEEIGDGEALRILLPGNIGLSKGKELVKRIKHADEGGRVEFHVLGDCDEDLKPWVVDHGRYQRGEFAARVRAIQPHIAAVLSIWPETYCHTLTESWACGLPVLGVAHGAVAERIGRHGGGWLVEGEADAILGRLLEIRESKEDRSAKIESVMRWQAGYGKKNTTARMSEHYLALYQRTLTSRRQLFRAGRKRTAFVMKGRYPHVPATAYVRLVDWKAWFEREHGQPVDYVEWNVLLASGVAGYSKVVIQRDAIPADRVDAVVDALRRFGVDYTYELDDDLFDVPDVVDQDGAYGAYADVLPILCENAASIHVTNRNLAERCRRYNDNVVIRANRISRSRWKLDGTKDKHMEEDLGLPSGQVKILYFGSKTHHEDIEFVLDAVGRARESGVEMKMYVVGGSDMLRRDDRLVQRLSPPSHRYDHFVAWLARVAGNFDLGVAPLLETPFSASKSHLKLLEYLAVGLPVVCSDLPPYSDLKGKFGHEVAFVPNDIEAWAKCLLSFWDRIRARATRSPAMLDEIFVNDW